jgi:hypothetical protein
MLSIEGHEAGMRACRFQHEEREGTKNAKTFLKIIKEAFVSLRSSC